MDPTQDTIQPTPGDPLQATPTQYPDQQVNTTETGQEGFPAQAQATFPEQAAPVVPAVPEPPKKSKLGSIILIFLLVLAASAAGLLAYQNSQLRQQLEEKPEPTPIPLPTVTPTEIPTPTPTVNPTADWEIYTNSELGFSIKLPEEINPFVASEGPEAGERVDFAVEQPFISNNYWFWIMWTPNPDRLSATKIADNYLENHPEPVDDVERKNIVVAGTNAVDLYPVPSLTDTKFVYVVNEDQLFTITLQAGTIEKLNNEAMNSFDQILTTFQFLE